MMPHLWHTTIDEMFERRKRAHVPYFFLHVFEPKQAPSINVIILVEAYISEGNDVEMNGPFMAAIHSILNDVSM